MRKHLLKFPKLTGPLRAYYNKYFGEKEINHLFKEFKKYKNNYIFYDVGANYGIFTFLFGRLSVFTITFDPIKECIKYIKRGYIYKNILLVNQAVSDNEITLNINIPIEDNEKIFGKSSITNQFDCSETRSIQTVTLDQYLEDIKQLNTAKLFIKIDVEGYEYPVLEGALNTLRLFRPVVMFELNELTLTLSGRSEDEYLRFATDNEYSVFGLQYGFKRDLLPIKTVEQLKLVSDLILVPL